MIGVGITEHDIIQVAFNYGLFMGAFRFNQGAELIGAAVVPASIAPADIQIRIMRDFLSTPSWFQPRHLPFISSRP